MFWFNIFHSVFSNLGTGGFVFADKVNDTGVPWDYRDKPRNLGALRVYDAGLETKLFFVCLEPLYDPLLLVPILNKSLRCHIPFFSDELKRTR